MIIKLLKPLQSKIFTVVLVAWLVWTTLPSELQAQQTQSFDRGKQQELYRVSRAARSAESNGKLERALELWRAVNSINPGSPSAYQGIKRCLLGLERYDEALTFLDQMLEQSRSGKNPLDPLTIAADRVEVFYTRKDTTAANRILESILREYQGNSKIYLEMSNILAGQRMSDEAIEVLLRGRRECGDRLLFSRDLARWYESRMDWGAAISEYLLHLEESPHRLSFITGAFGDMAVEPGADSLTVRLISDRIDNSKGDFQNLLRRLLASLHFRHQRYQEALAQYQILERASGDQGKELLEFASLTMAEGEYQIALTAYQEILAGNPSGNLRAEVQLGIGLSYLQLGFIDSAKVSYQEIVLEKQPVQAVFEALSRLGLLEFRILNNPAQAREYFEGALKISSPANMSSIQVNDLHHQIALTHIRENNLAEAEKILKRVTRSQGRANPSVSTARYELALLYLRQGQVEQFLSESGNLLITDPSAPEVNEILEWRALANDLTDTPELLISFGKIDLALFQGRLDEARADLLKITEEGSNAAAEAAWWKLAEIASDSSEPETAINYLKSILELNNAVKKDLALLMLGNIFERFLNEPQEALVYYERLLIEFPDSPLTERARAHLKAVSQEL